MNRVRVRDKIRQVNSLRKSSYWGGTTESERYYKTCTKVVFPEPAIPRTITQVGFLLGLLTLALAVVSKLDDDAVNSESTSSSAFPKDNAILAKE